MPVVAIVAAVGSVSAGMALGISTLAGGLMVAGGVMTGLGAITGNQKLSKLGAIASLGGGLAGLASGAISFGGAAAGAEFAAPSLDLSGAIDPSIAGGAFDVAGATGGMESAASSFGGGQFVMPEAAGLGGGAAGTTSFGGAAPVGLAESGGLISTASGTSFGPLAAPSLDAVGLSKIQTGLDGGFFSKAKGFMQDPKNTNLINVSTGALNGLAKSYGEQDMLDQKIAYNDRLSAEALAQKEADRKRFNDSIINQRMYR